MGATRGIDDFLRVAGKITDHKIELCNADGKCHETEELFGNHVSQRNYVTRVLDSPLQVDAAQWDDLLARQSHPTPFMRHAYLTALFESGSATAETGWTVRFMTLWAESTAADNGGELLAACPLYLKTHSWGEYVFDWAWAQAYERHGLHYYPKAVVAVPFTPVTGSRLLARDDPARAALAEELVRWCQAEQVSSLHLLFASAPDLAAATHAGLMPRSTIQFHWQNTDPGYASFDDFLSHLNQEKRKKIRQEQRKVAQAGITFRCLTGNEITPQDWNFFYRCYRQTYLEHGHAPYLSRAFFERMAKDMPTHWQLHVAQRHDADIACSLIALSEQDLTAYGRYWGALERVDCLHFDACYYQPLQWCIEHGYRNFEGGAQGQHKLARALLPVQTSSAHWLAHPGFAEAVGQFLTQERTASDEGQAVLLQRSPFRKTG